MRVNAEIKVGDHAGHILAVQVVVGHVDIPHTPSNNTQGQKNTDEQCSRSKTFWCDPDPRILASE